MQELFLESSLFPVNLPDAEIEYFPDFYTTKEADFLYQKLNDETPWKAEKIKVFGKEYDQPRLTALHTEEQKSYTYANLTLKPMSFTPLLNEILLKIKTVDDAQYNAVLLNLYRHGQDSNGWHADNEKELGLNPTIASISLGEERYFHLKHRRHKDQRYKIKLKHGSLLIMKGPMQHHWLHQIPKTTKPIDSRINLTFRNLIH